MINRLFNTGIRLASLGLKMCLALYMGKYLGLDEMGTYGLVAAFVAVMINFIGFRIDYVVGREIVGAPEKELTTKIRDEGAFFLLNYAFIALAVFILYLSPYDSFDNTILIYTFSLSVLESFAAVLSGNLVSMNRPILSNFLFFIRSAAWVPLVIFMGYFYPEYRNAEIIFSFWLGGIILSLLVNVAVWKNLPWKDAFAKPVNKTWIATSVKTCFFIWLGGLAAAFTANIDRFVVEYFIGREAVGVVSFYGSFVTAVLSLMASGVFAFVYPVLIRLYKEKQLAAFRAEAVKATWHAAVFSALICIAMGAIIPYFGVLFERPELTDYAPIFWMLLLGVWIRTATDAFYYVLYAWSEDVVLWTTSLVSLAFALIVNVLFIASFGIAGVGYGAIASSVFLGLWRIWWLRKLFPKHSASASDAL